MKKTIDILIDNGQWTMDNDMTMDNGKWTMDNDMKRDNGKLKVDNENNFQLPEGWEVKKLGEVCKLVRGPFGGSLKKSIFKESGYAVYEQKHAIHNRFDNIRYYIDENKFKEMKRFELNPGDLIMSCSGTIGKIAIVPESIKKGIINQALLILSPTSNLYNLFLKFWMQSENFQESLNKFSKGAAIKNIASVKVLKNIEIPTPPLPEQKRIVAILDRTFEAIDRAKTNAEQNLKSAKEVFESYLNRIFENGKLKVDSGEWEEKKLGEIGKVQTGNTPPTKDKLNYGEYIPFAKPPHFKRNGKIETGNSMLSETGLKKGRLFEANSILMVCIGATIGKTGFLEKSISANQQINGLTPLKNYYARFFYYAFISEFVQKQVLEQGKSAQATLPIINKTKWGNILVPFPKSIETQKQIVAKLDKLQSETKKLEEIYQKKIVNLEELKKSVLEKAFSGQL